MDVKRDMVIKLSKTAIGIIIGLIGGVTMIFLETDTFQLHFVNGFLFLIVMIAIVLSAIVSFILAGVGVKKYWTKVYVGFVAFFIATSMLRLSQVIDKNQTWELSKTNILGSTIIILVIGFIISLLLALIKNKND